MCFFKYLNTSAVGSVLSASNIKSGWTVEAQTRGNTTNTYYGFRLVYDSSKIALAFFGTDNKAGNFRITPPSSVDTTQFHHHAFTRKGSTIRYFFDGNVIFETTYSGTLAFPDQITVGSSFWAEDARKTEMHAWSYSDIVDDLYIAETCKWESDFDPTSITY